MNIAETLLNLNSNQLKERKQARKDYYYFKGKTQYEIYSLTDFDLLGQSWIPADELDYVPSQDIRNKVKPLLQKQARFMFSKEPDILFKPFDSKDKKKCEKLRQFVDKILEENSFWYNSLKAFLMCTIKKRVLLRLEANPNTPINITYENIDNFTYEKQGKNIKSITLVAQDPITLSNEAKDEIWYKYTFYMESTCKIKKETFTGDFDPNSPSVTELNDSGLSKIPAWVIINGGLLGDDIGESDLEDLKSPQDQYNRRVSDFADALRFQMFGQTVITDATEESVNQARIAPNSLLPLVSLDEKRKADAKRLESSFSNAEPVEMFLKRAEQDMRDTLSMPSDDKMKDIPSAKALKYLYNDLIARCEEKWLGWTPAIKGLIKLIIEACSKFSCYPDWDPEWNNLKFRIVLKHNYPIPEDEEDKKRLGMEEVNSNVRSHRSYIKDFSDDEDTEGQIQEIVDDIALITAAENEQYVPGGDGNVEPKE